jgi:hypothetical protein
MTRSLRCQPPTTVAFTLNQYTIFVVDERGRLLDALDPETVRGRLAAESLPYLLIAGDLADHECPWLSVSTSRDEARALFESRSTLRFVPIVDDEGILVGEAIREDHVG